MAKRTSKKGASPKSKAKQDASMPALHLAEQMMQGLFGERDQSFDAQEHAYNAMEAMAAEDWERAAAAAMAAVKLDPNCVDALLVMSHLGSETEEDLIENLRRTVERGERALGKKFFKDNAGYFWGMLETRPYMRARAELADILNETGQSDEAISHLEDMLRLNPSDNQGLRYRLLGCYLEKQNLEGAARIFADYAEEESAMFAWARVLADFLAGNELAASKALAEARQANKHVEAYLTDRKKTSDDGPGYYSPGDPSEAIVCVHEIGTAWTMHPAAVTWLKRQKPKRGSAALKPPKNHES